jgi:hypothetical protein
MGELLITLDIDWAPDFIVDEVASVLVDANVKATWFVTHASPAIDRLKSRPNLFELGIHPNFLPESTHGNTMEEVLRACMEMQPHATSMRAHSLVQSTEVLASVLEVTPIWVDVSLFLPHAKYATPVEYWWQGKRLLRIPFVWEDDVEGMRPQPLWSPTPFVHCAGPLSVMNFHPIHLHLNDSSMTSYRILKERKADIKRISCEDTVDLIQDGEGPRKMFDMVVEHVAKAGGGRTISEVAETHRVLCDRS